MRPRIIHLSWLPDPEAWPGITCKLHQMARRAAEDGLGFAVGACTAGKPVGGGVLSFPVASGRMAALLKGRRIGRILADLGDPACILRWPGALDPTLPNLITRHGRRLFTEHHADEAAELDLLARGPWLRLRAQAERLQTPRLLAQVAGVIGVTAEIRAGLCARARVRSSSVISNGITVDAVTPTGFRPFAGDRLDLVWSCGRFWPWQGLDRLLAGLAQHRGPPDIVLHLLGADPGVPAHPAPGVSVLVHGQLLGPAADAVYRSAHLGVGTLALHRKGLREACPLKVREYLARGLPFVSAHLDPDIPADAPWVLRLPDTEEAIDPGQLIAFAERLRGLDTLQVRDHALRHCDWRIKLSQMMAFAASVALRRDISLPSGDVPWRSATGGSGGVSPPYNSKQPGDAENGTSGSGFAGL